MHMARPAQVLYGSFPEGVQDEGPKRYGAQGAHWIEVNENDLLADVLARSDYVVPGIPVFFVVVKGSDFQARLLSDEIPLL